MRSLRRPQHRTLLSKIRSKMCVSYLKTLLNHILNVDHRMHLGPSPTPLPLAAQIRSPLRRRPRTSSWQTARLTRLETLATSRARVLDRSTKKARLRPLVQIAGALQAPRVRARSKSLSAGRQSLAGTRTNGLRARTR